MNWFTVILLILGALSQFSESKNVDIGRNFIYMIRRNKFFGQDSLSPVEFMPSLEGFPDTPKWVKFFQKSEFDNAYLYGTPDTDASDSNLEIIALNKNTFQTTRKTLQLNVREKTSPRYFLELRIKNFDLEDMLSGTHLSRLLEKVQTVWLVQNLHVTNVVSLLDLGGRAPLPDASGNVPKQGVLVQFGSPTDFSGTLKNVELEIRGRSCEEGGDKTPIVSIRSRFQPEYDVDWCKYRLVEPSMISTTPVPEPSPIKLTAPNYNPPPERAAPRDFLFEFILCIVVPVGLGFILLLILSYVMCGRREGVKKRNKMTPEQQMIHFNAIKKATANMRSLSNRRFAPTPMEGTATPPRAPYPGLPSAEGAEDQQETTPARGASDPRSHQAPPPYRIPPSYPVPGDNTPVGQPQQSSTPARAGTPQMERADDRTGEEQHLVLDADKNPKQGKGYRT